MKISPVEPPKDTLVNISGTGEPPKRRIESVEAARSVYDDCVSDQESAARVRARIRGLVDGNPPYDPAELQRLGQSWRTNFNAREAEAIIDTNSAALWEMQQDLFVLARVTPVSGVDGADPGTGLDFGSVLSEEYTRTLRAWPKWVVFTDLVIHDAMESGAGAAVWTDPDCWRPEWFNISNFVFPKNASCTVTELDFFFLRDEIPLHKLYKVVMADKDKVESLGWDIGQVKKLLLRLFGYGDSNASSSTTDMFQMSPWESLQQQIKNNDPGIQRRQFEGVRVVRMYVRELDEGGGVTQLIFPEDDVAVPLQPSSDGTMAEFEDSFLFQKQRQFDSMPQCLWWLLYSYGDGYLRSVKGLGHRITPHCEVSNRLIGSTFDAGIMGASLLLQPTAGGDLSKLQIMRAGPVTYIPEYMQAIQTSFNPRVDGLLLLRDMSTSILNNNTGVFKVKDENPMKRDAEKTARQVVSEEGKEARFEKNQAAFFYAQWDLLHKEIFRRLMSRSYASSSLDLEGKKEAKDFRDRCIARGIPEDLMDAGIWEVRAERAIGLGSPGMRMDVTSQALSIKGMLPEENQVHVVREFLAARFGAQHVDRFMPLRPRDKFVSDAASIATLENNDFNEGAWVPVGSDQLHGIHLPVHFAPLVQIMQAASDKPESIEPQKALVLFSVALPHIQQHLAFMAQDHLPQDTTREAKLKEFVGLFKQAAEFRGRLEGVVKKMAQAQQKKQIDEAKQAEAMEEELERRNVEIEKYKIDQQAQLDRYKADQLHQARMMKTNTSIEASVRRVLADLQNKSALTQAEITSKMQKTQADVAAKSAKAGSGGA